MNNTKNAPEIFFIYNNGKLDNFYLDFADAEKHMLELVDDLCDNFLEWVEEGEYSIDEMQSQLLHNRHFSFLSIEVMDFENGVCYADNPMCSIDICTKQTFRYQDLESCIARIVERQHKYKEANKK